MGACNTPRLRTESSLSCLSRRDPGGSKSTIKKINKDKSMGQRWDHFVTAPKVTAAYPTWRAQAPASGDACVPQTAYDGQGSFIEV